jgi:hypothetical protein
MPKYLEIRLEDLPRRPTPNAVEYCRTVHYTDYQLVAKAIDIAIRADSPPATMVAVMQLVYLFINEQ